ncbi:beta-lactamase family protein [Paenibacillus sp. GSMTC-2017]|nr:beta-lactamase family protein [Paenibacillus sp. GSMTC-2017]
MKRITSKRGLRLTLSALLISTLALPAHNYVKANEVQTRQSIDAAANINNVSGAIVTVKKDNKNLAYASAEASRNKIKNLIDESVKSKYIPGIVAGGLQNGERWTYASGLASIEDSYPMEPHFSFRVGSVTKTFVAAVVLQLAQEKKLNLDDSVEKWLPGVVKGNGYDGSKVLISQLLNHRSGIASYTDNDFRDITIPQNPYRYYTTTELIDKGLAKPPVFSPGTNFDYSNTNTILAGLIIEKVTGETYAEQIKKRFIDPLRLTGTSVRGSNPLIPGDHARGYNLDRTMKLHDFTEFNPSWGNAAGDMVSTADDLITFMSALLGGELLNDEMMKEMTTGHPSPFGNFGLGILQIKLPNGEYYWAAAGGTHGFSTLAGGPLGGKHIMVLNTNAVGPEVDPNHFKIFDKEFSR